MDFSPQSFWENSIFNWDENFKVQNRALILDELIKKAQEIITENTTNVDFGCATACVAQLVGVRNFIGIDVCQSYLDIAKTRIDRTINRDFFDVNFEF